MKIQILWGFFHFTQDNKHRGFVTGVIEGRPVMTWSGQIAVMRINSVKNRNKNKSSDEGCKLSVNSLIDS